MPPVRKGQIVRSKAGRDKDKFLVVVDVKIGGAMLSDGKERPLERPKFKNFKHLAPTAKHLTERELLTNKSVLHSLRDYSQTVKGDE